MKQLSTNINEVKESIITDQNIIQNTCEDMNIQLRLKEQLTKSQQEKEDNILKHE